MSANANGNRACPPVRHTPAEPLKELQKIGKRFDPDVLGQMSSLYVPILKDVVWQGIDIDRDKSYGPDPRHLLDVHAPKERPAAPLPVVMFFHGGGLIAGHKNAQGDALQGSILNYFVENGFVGVNCTYRLAPAIKWPEGGRDVGAALAWVRENIAGYGGDPARVVLIGTSAGGTHVATYAFRTALHPPGGPGCAGIALISGFFALEKQNPAPNRVAYYGEDTSKYDAMRVLGNVERADFPVFISVAENDPILFETGAYELAAELTRHGNSPRVKLVLDHNHVSQTMAIGTGDASLGPDLVDFARRATGG